MPRITQAPPEPTRRDAAGRAVARCALAACVAWMVVLCGCVSIPGALRAPLPGCLPHFAYDQGWLGGDAVYSIPVPGGEDARRTIWIFGDTYVGAPSAGDRTGATLIHDSVGVSRCNRDGEFEIDYAWRRSENGTPSEVFASERERHYLWPFDGFFLGDRLYVLLLEVRTDSPRGPFGLPIRITRSFIARVSNPEDPPGFWRTELRALTQDGGPLLSPGVHLNSDHVHLMATPNGDDAAHPRFLVRLPLAVVEAWPEDLASALETFTHRGAWERGLYAANARVLMPDNATEMTLDRIGESGPYFAVYSAPLQSADDGTPSTAPALDANSIFVRTARSLTGPWSERARLHVIGEGLERGAGAGAAAAAAPAAIRTICYAGKAHAEHSPREVLVLSYVCNLAPGPGGDGWAVLEAMKTRMDVYRPRVAVAPWPELPAFAPADGTGDDGL